jgi:hypothetical protein
MRARVFLPRLILAELLEGKGKADYAEDMISASHDKIIGSVVKRHRSCIFPSAFLM